MSRLSNWLREASANDSTDSLITRCNVAANHVDAVDKNLEEYKTLVDKALKTSEEFKNLYKRTFDYRVLCRIKEWFK